MKCKCGGTSRVTTTLKPATGGVIRHRKCEVCGDNFRTIETHIEARGVGRPVTRIKNIPVYTPDQVSKIKAVKTAVRRKSEDIQENKQRRNRVSSYFIEDDFDDL